MPGSQHELVAVEHSLPTNNLKQQYIFFTRRCGADAFSRIPTFWLGSTTQKNNNKKHDEFSLKHLFLHKKQPQEEGRTFVISASIIL